MTRSRVSPFPSGWNRAWWIGVWFYVVAGLLSLIWVPSTLRVVPGVLVMSAIGTFLTVSLTEDTTEESLRGQLSRSLRMTLLYAGGLLATVSHLAVLGPLTLLLLGALAASSPWLLARIDVADGPVHDVDASPSNPGQLDLDTSVLPPDVVDPDLRSMSTRALAGGWGRTYWLLERAATCQARMQIVAERQRLLDELERRDAIALRRWLESGPRAAADPAKYFPHGEPPGAVAS